MQSSQSIASSARTVALSSAIQPAAPCGAPLAASARFCQRCGTPRGEQRAQVPGQLPQQWLWYGVFAVVAIAIIVLYAIGKPGSAPVDTVAPGPTGPAPPDLSTMTTREQFSRLSDRVTAAAESSDTNVVRQFWPMVLAAYQNLSPGQRDADARFHMGWLYLQTGNRVAASALADSILAASPDNLFGYDLRASVADASGDSASARKARADFKLHYNVEIKRTDRPGYEEHRAMFERMLKGAS